MKKLLSAMFLIAGMGLFGCAQQQTTPTAEPTEGAGAAAPAEGAAAAGAQTTPGFTGSPLEDPASPLSKRVFYFPFDSSEVSAEDREIIKAHAQFLAANPNASVVIEGHADERGSREYNLALGERRAQAVEKLLLLQGMSKGQQQVISFGEERPAAQGHDESAWRLNRRVELLYSGV
ncbi:MAG: peptidoglycan-associated lipoprotein Pal [Thiohalomonadaceae bacterium]